MLRDRLLALLNDDERVRTRLAATGALFEGYHPEMAAVHQANAAKLDALLQGVWPSARDAGTDGQSAAWHIVQHAIGSPDFQRRYLAAIGHAVSGGDAPGWQAAKLEDRIRVFEGRPQRYGTQFDWDLAGALSPALIEDPVNVDDRRALVGLGPLSQTMDELRTRAQLEGQRPPADPAKRAAEFAAWARRVGWRD